MIASGTLRGAGFALVALLLLALSPRVAAAQGAIGTMWDIGGRTKSVACEVLGQLTIGPTLILLHGASGPASALYHEQAEFFAAHGFRVILPHYFDATRSSATPTKAHYSTWAEVVRGLVEASGKSPIAAQQRVVLLGFSLGASVALAAGSQGVPVAAIAEWYGSLPDEFFYRMQGMPPLLILHGGRDATIPVNNAQQLIQLCGLMDLTCDSRIYPDQPHGFDTATVKDADARSLAFFAKFVSWQ